MSLRVVYYSGFWYSAHSQIGNVAYDMIGNQGARLSRISDDLRLLALFFDEIHVPRSHFLTFQNDAHWNVVNQYVNSSDYRILSLRKILTSSRLPYLDAHNDTERIVERVAHQNWSKEMGRKHIHTVKGQEATQIDSKSESARNVDRFQEYIELLKDEDRKLGTRLDEIKKRSNYRDIPFLHELFVEEVSKSDALSAAEKKRIWRDTNSMYMSSGGLELGDHRRISFDLGIETENATHDNSGTLRSLYSSRFIASLIREELGVQSLTKYLTADISAILKFREKSSEIFDAWQAFRTHIEELMKFATLYVKYEPKALQFTDAEIITQYKAHLIKNDGKMVASVLSDLAVSLGGGIDPVAGAVIGASKSLIGHKITSWLKSRAYAVHLSEYQKFWTLLKKELPA